MLPSLRIALRSSALRPASAALPARALLSPHLRTYSSPAPVPGPTPTPETLAYIRQFRDQARAAGYDNDGIARLMDAEVAAGRMPPEGPRAVRTLGRLHQISVAFLVLVMGALLVVPAARHGRKIFKTVAGAGEETEGRKREVEYPRPRRLGEREGGE